MCLVNPEITKELAEAEGHGLKKKKDANLPKTHKLKKLGMDFMFLSSSFSVLPSATSCFSSLSIFMTTPMKVH